MKKIGAYYIHNSCCVSTDNSDIVHTSETIVYEVVRIISNKSIFLADHLIRLNKSVAAISGIPISPKEEKNLKEACLQLIELNKIINGNVYLQFFTSSRSSLVHQCETNYPTAVQYEQGIRAELFAAERELPNVKRENTNVRNKTNQKLKQSSAYELILYDKKRKITEGSRSNFFCLIGKVVYTAPPNTVLVGITRKYVINACKNIGLQIVEEAISIDDLEKIDCAFITGTSPKVLPVHHIGECTLDVESVLLRNILSEYENLMQDNKGS